MRVLLTVVDQHLRETTRSKQMVGTGEDQPKAALLLEQRHTHETNDVLHIREPHY